MKRFNMILTEEMHTFIQQNAEKRGLTMNAVVIVALEYYFQHHDHNQFEVEESKKPE